MLGPRVWWSWRVMHWAMDSLRKRRAADEAPGVFVLGGVAEDEADLWGVVWCGGVEF